MADYQVIVNNNCDEPKNKFIIGVYDTKNNSIHLPYVPKIYI